MTHQGAKDQHIQILLVGERTLFTILFDERTTLGMVRFYANETSTRLEEIFARTKERQHSSEEEVKLGEAFSDAVKDHLGDVFGS